MGGMEEFSRIGLELDEDLEIEAKIQYKPQGFNLLNNGWFVKCAVTGKKIYLEDLRYWNVERQEAYVDAETSFKRELEFRNEK